MRALIYLFVDATKDHLDSITASGARGCEEQA